MDVVFEENIVSNRNYTLLKRRKKTNLIYVERNKFIGRYDRCHCKKILKNISSRK